MNDLLFDALILVGSALMASTALGKGHFELHRKFERQTDPFAFWLFVGLLLIVVGAKTLVIVKALS